MLETLLSKVKKNIRISNTKTEFDDELENLIKACVLDLKSSGVASSALPVLEVETSTGTEETDPLIERAIITYCKAHFGFDNPDYEKLLLSYEEQKKKLCIIEDYAEPYVVEE